jgi:histone H3/H4
MITKPAIKRFMRKAGIARLSSQGYIHAAATLLAYTRSIIQCVCIYADYRKKKIIRGADVQAAAKSLGLTLYAEEIDGGAKKLKKPKHKASKHVRRRTQPEKTSIAMAVDPTITTTTTTATE